jgi:hypothetical protein
MAQGGGQGELIGLVHLDYRGTRHVLGRTADAYAIWDAAGRPPRQTFPLSDEGWIQAWQEYQRLEASAAWTAPAAGPPGPGGMAPGGGPGVPGGMAPGAEAYALDYPGGRYGLGRAQGQYIIWDLQTQAGVRAFPLTDEGWAEAWRTFRELDEPYTFVPTSYWQKGRPIPIRAMRAGQVIGGGFKLYFMYFGRLVALAAIALVPAYAITGALSLATGELVPVEPGAPAFGSYVNLNGRSFTFDNPWWVDVVNGVVSWVAYSFLVGATVVLLARAVGFGEQGVGNSLGRAVRKLPPLLVVALLQAVALFVAILPAILVNLAATLRPGIGLALLGSLVTLAVIAPALYVVTRFLYAPPAVMLEGRGGVAAVRRSWALVRGLGWRAIGCVVLSLLILLGVFVVVFIILALVLLAGVIGAAGAAPDPDSFTTYFIATFVVIAVLSILMTPYLYVVSFLLYLDARVRKEGFSEQVLAREWEAQAPSRVAPAGPTPPFAGPAPPPGP